uniref:Uncharacterized protein n=1 Tax=Glossina brevipalpis TaxID=37001 RepID=A0A1A9WQF0_9MUSC
MDVVAVAFCVDDDGDVGGGGGDGGGAATAFGAEAMMIAIGSSSGGGGVYFVRFRTMCLTNNNCTCAVEIDWVRQSLIEHFDKFNTNIRILTNDLVSWANGFPCINNNNNNNNNTMVARAYQWFKGANRLSCNYRYFGLLMRVSNKLQKFIS